MKWDNTFPDVPGEFHERVSATLKVLETQEKHINIKKERVKTMKLRKPILIAAVLALTLALSVTAYALVSLLTPAEVAKEMEQDKLADAFENDGTDIDETIISNDDENYIGYSITLHGLVSGENLNEYRDYADIKSDETYIMVSLAHEDGSPIIYGPQPDGSLKHFFFAVLFEGYRPWMFSSWHFGSGGAGFEKDGIYYNMYQVDENIEIFANRKVYLAIWDSELIMCPVTERSKATGPNSDVFKINTDGTIEFADEFEKAHAMFVLPLDPAKANPEKVQQLLEELDALDAAID